MNTKEKELLEAFGGFYKQLVQGTRCTGPEALAANERRPGALQYVYIYIYI